MSRYLEGDLDARRRAALEDHIGRCPRCRRELASLADTVAALRSLERDVPKGLAGSIISAMRAEPPREAATGKRSGVSTAAPVLTVVSTAAGDDIRKDWWREARPALRWSLHRSQLRFTLPIALLAGVVLSVVNMGGMLMHGRIDLGVCVSCAVDFVVPFLAVNLGLLLLSWLPRRRRPPVA